MPLSAPTIERTDTSEPNLNDGFDLDVALLEITDTAGLISLTDDGCGSTCGPCTTNVA